MVNRVVNLGYTADEGPRIYIERINIRGNTRTRDYVIRREFDAGEGDAYNRALVDRAERRLKALAYFKTVKISQEPGSSPDRVVLNVDVEDQPTGQFSIGAGYSTNDGILGEVSIAEQNFLGRGQFVKLSGTNGQKSRGLEFSFTEPFFLGYRISAGFDIFSRYSDQTDQGRYTSQTTGGTIRFGLPITDEVSVGLRYSLFQTDIKIPNTFRDPFNDCNVPIPGLTPTAGGTGFLALSTFNNCLTNGEASLAVKEARGRRITSLLGLNVIYNTLDNPKEPTSGILATLSPEIAGLGGDARFLRVTGEARYYQSIWDDVIGMAKVQAGHIQGFGGNRLLLTDHFNPGSSLVRGFAPGGFGPRDVSYDTRNGSLGGTTYYGASVEVNFPIFGLPKEIGIRGAVFADAGALLNYSGYRQFVNVNGRSVGVAGPGCALGANINLLTQGNCIAVQDSGKIRASVGASLLWQSPLGPIRFDYAFPIAKDRFDRTQAFRFSGGGRF
jgi:outer membrane protein insertion porin family